MRDLPRMDNDVRLLSRQGITRKERETTEETEGLSLFFRLPPVWKKCHRVKLNAHDLAGPNRLFFRLTDFQRGEPVASRHDRGRLAGRGALDDIADSSP